MGNYNKSLADWNPGDGKGRNQSATDKLMSTVAKDNSDSLTPNNEQKEFTGGKGMPSGPFGKKGCEF